MKRLGVFPVAIQEDIALAVQEAILRIGQVPGDLLDPGLAGGGRRSGEANPASRKLHDKQQVEGDQALRGPDFEGGEIDRRQHRPVGLEERLPGGLPPALGCRFDPLRFEDLADGGGGDLMAEVEQGTLDPPITPARILAGEAND